MKNAFLLILSYFHRKFFVYSTTRAHTHILKSEKQPWSHLEKPRNSQPIKCPFVTEMSVTSRNKSAKWNIAEVICASLLNGPFTQTPHPFASSNTFWL